MEPSDRPQGDAHHAPKKKGKGKDKDGSDLELDDGSSSDSNSGDSHRRKKKQSLLDMQHAGGCGGGGGATSGMPGMMGMPNMGLPGMMGMAGNGGAASAALSAMQLQQLQLLQRMGLTVRPGMTAQQLHTQIAQLLSNPNAMAVYRQQVGSMQMAPARPGQYNQVTTQQNAALSAHRPGSMPLGRPGGASTSVTSGFNLSQVTPQMAASMGVSQQQLAALQAQQAQRQQFQMQQQNQRQPQQQQPTPQQQVHPQQAQAAMKAQMAQLQTMHQQQIAGLQQEQQQALQQLRQRHEQMQQQQQNVAPADLQQFVLQCNAQQTQTQQHQQLQLQNMQHQQMQAQYQQQLAQKLSSMANLGGAAGQPVSGGGSAPLPAQTRNVPGSTSGAGGMHSGGGAAANDGSAPGGGGGGMTGTPGMDEAINQSNGSGGMHSGSAGEMQASGVLQQQQQQHALGMQGQGNEIRSSGGGGDMQGGGAVASGGSQQQPGQGMYNPAGMLLHKLQPRFADTINTSTCSWSIASCQRTPSSLAMPPAIAAAAQPGSKRRNNAPGPPAPPPPPSVISILMHAGLWSRMEPSDSRRLRLACKETARLSCLELASATVRVPIERGFEWSPRGPTKLPSPQQLAAFHGRLPNVASLHVLLDSFSRYNGCPDEEEEEKKYYELSSGDGQEQGEEGEPEEMAEDEDEEEEYEDPPWMASPTQYVSDYLRALPNRALIRVSTCRIDIMNRQVSAGVFKRLVTRLPRLVDLDLCEKLPLATAAGVSGLVKCPHLRSLTIRAQHMTNVTICALARHLSNVPHLQALHLTGTEMTVATLLALADSPLRLQELSFHKRTGYPPSFGMMDAGYLELEQLAREEGWGLPHVRTLKLAQRNSVDPQEIAALLAFMPSLRALRCRVDLPSHKPLSETFVTTLRRVTDRLSASGCDLLIGGYLRDEDMALCRRLGPFAGVAHLKARLGQSDTPHTTNRFREAAVSLAATFPALQHLKLCLNGDRDVGNGLAERDKLLALVDMAARLPTLRALDLQSNSLAETGVRIDAQAQALWRQMVMGLAMRSQVVQVRLGRLKAEVEDRRPVKHPHMDACNTFLAGADHPLRFFCARSGCCQCCRGLKAQPIQFEDRGEWDYY